MADDDGFVLNEPREGKAEEYFAFATGIKGFKFRK